MTRKQIEKMLANEDLPEAARVALEAELEKLPEARPGRPALTHEERVERELSKLRAKQEARALLKGQAGPGRPPLSPEERTAREREKLRARETAKAQIKLEREARALQRVLPYEAGVWKNEDGQILHTPNGKSCAFVLSNGEYSKCVQADTLDGKWTKVGEFPMKENRAVLDTSEHERKTRRWKERRLELFDQGLRPCANFDCNQTLAASDHERFCKTCLENLKNDSRNTAK